MRKYLLIVDLVNDYLERLGRAERLRIVAAANELAAAFRSKELPVVWVRQEFEPDRSDAFPEMRAKNIAVTIRGTRGAELDPTLNRRPDDAVVVKKRYSAFFGTDLDAYLARRGIGEAVLCGVNTHACIRTTAIDAYQRDLRVVIAAEAVGSYDATHARMSLDYMRGRIAEVMTNDEIVTELANG